MTKLNACYDSYPVLCGPVLMLVPQSEEGRSHQACTVRMDYTDTVYAVHISSSVKTNLNNAILNGALL